ncbi:hypothetical protein NPIL_637711 [Nephila pilipes]|uniref:Uncharacterized protein n=1 Tax=Nephila pilipes TaxID=299642 RepID=A0A8X6U7A4_NEPPI|nr:hypothetical protein NPIL_637711 [Nephila pilipes]
MSPLKDTSAKLVNEELKFEIYSNSAQGISELDSKLNVSKRPISILLQQFGKIKKLDEWMPHETNDNQSLETCFFFLFALPPAI